MLNAIEAMGAAGILDIKLTQEGNFIKIIFEDTGPGINDEIKEKIFEPLFSTKKNGTGFGLATVKRLIMGNGGMISVDSEEGKGARFVVKIPVQK